MLRIHLEGDVQTRNYPSGLALILGYPRRITVGEVDRDVGGEVDARRVAERLAFRSSPENAAHQG